MYSGFVLIELLGILLTFVAIALIMHMDGSNARMMMICFMIGVLVENAGNLFEALSQEPAEAVVAIKLQYLGVCFVPFFFSQFVFLYCNQRQPLWVFRCLAVMDILVLLTVWTCDRHSLFYKEMRFVTDGSHPHFEFSYGWGFWGYILFGAFIPFALAVLAMIRSMMTGYYQTRKRHYIMVITLAAVPVTVVLLRATQRMRDYDLVPPVLAIVLSSVVIFVWSRRNYDLSRAAAKTVLHEIQDGVIYLDDQHRIVNYNPAMGKIFNELNNQMIGKPVTKIDHFPQEILSGGGSREFNLENRHFTGHMEPVNDKKGTLLGYIILIFDITQNKQLITESIKMREKAEAASRAKSEFIATMSHEMRTPMNAIVGFAELIKEESLGRKVYQYACDIKDASGRLLNIFNDIWDISAIEAGKMELVQKNYSTVKLFQDAAQKVSSAAKEKGLDFRQNISDSLPAGLYGDEERIGQVLNNVLDNAVKFTNEGHVSMSVEAEDISKDQVTLKILIEDTGIGIEEENLRKIFHNFEQVDSGENRSVEGMGLGLSVAKNLIELMGGSLHAASIFGEGSTFTISVPQKITDGRKISEVKASEPENEIQMFTAPESHILIVDDNLINRKIVKGMLKNYGCRVDEAESGPEAINLVNQYEYDIVFMDHMMPEMDGIEATRIIREDCGKNGKDAVIIALTANALNGIEETFLNNGFQDFIAKPMDRIHLHRVLSKWIPEHQKQEAAIQIAADDVELKEIESIFIKGINIKSVMEKHAGNLNEYIDILDLFYVDGLRKEKYLQALKEEKDYENYRIEVHALKGAAGNIGAQDLSRQAQFLELAAAEGNEEFLIHNHDALIENYDSLLQEIKPILDKRKKKEPPRDSAEIKEPLKKEDIIKLLKEALHALEHFKSKECKEKVELLLTHESDEELRGNLLEAQSKLQLYEDDDAEELLRELIQKYE